MPGRARRFGVQMPRNAAEVVLMASGGARNRSGPSPDPASGRSDRRGLSFQALPNEGYRGRVPEFPLGDGPEATEVRELTVWAEAWRTPQAEAWALEPWRWPIIGEYCRLKAVVEADPSASAALVAQLHRYRDQIGLTPAGMRENGWQVAASEFPVTSSPDEGDEGDESAGRERPARRMRAVGGGA